MSLPARVRGRILEGIETLKDNPRPPRCTKLAGSRDEYRIRIGDYRVRYEIHDRESMVVVMVCDHRKDVYRR